MFFFVSKFFASHMKGAKGNQDHSRAQEGGHTNELQGGQFQGGIKTPP